MGDTILIRKMSPVDLPAVVEIEEACFASPWSREGFLAALERPDIAAYVYCPGRRLLAYFLLEFDGSEARVMNLAVHPDHRRHGIATECLRYAERAARRRNVLRIVLEVEESNLAAQLLYRKSGYRATRILRNYYPETSEDGYRMVRALSEPARTTP
jgi:ribosomal-protein-alanine N-acetyltransferase